jgi:phospholipid/cholesterol/gamma-HCH transport system permease protein
VAALVFRPRDKRGGAGKRLTTPKTGFMHELIRDITLSIGAAWLLAVYFFKIDRTYAWANMLQYTSAVHVLSGLIKSVVYGGVISIISCHKGMTCGEGAVGVGRATTEAVVYSSITVLISNFFLTLFLNRVLPAT